MVTKPFLILGGNLCMNCMSNDKVLFEISYEVCNKVGGIYTVVTSKLESVKKNFENYFAVGPYVKGRSEYDFVPKEIPYEFEKIFAELEEMGIKVHYGVWLRPEKPEVLLVEYIGFSSHVNEIKGKLWEYYQIDSLGSAWHDYDEVMLWSWCCGIVIDKLSNLFNGEVIAHGHEWMGGISLLYLTSLKSGNIRTVFTTHATMLGRALSGQGRLPVEIIGDRNPDDVAYESQVYTKHQTEKALALSSDCFTTVSKITAEEAEVVYGKTPDVVVPNGLGRDDVMYSGELERKYAHSREFFNKFLKGYFYAFEDFDSDNTQLFFTSGRNEFVNKGVDLFIDSLAMLNDFLKSEHEARDVVALFLIPVGEFEKDEFVFKGIDAFNSGEKIERGLNALPYSSHKMPVGNEIVQKFLDCKLFNLKGDKVKVVLLPFYLSGHDGILNKKYSEIIAGLDLGVFPSFYEPWGYTPQEAVGLGVPAVTSDLAGFGKYVSENNLTGESVSVIRRNGVSREESSEELYKVLRNFVLKDQKALMEQKLDCLRVAKELTWEEFFEKYLFAYNWAQNRK
ncbi:MAG: glycosyltransferase [Nanoarchaeota archaeon]